MQRFEVDDVVNTLLRKSTNKDEQSEMVLSQSITDILQKMKEQTTMFEEQRVDADAEELTSTKLRNQIIDRWRDSPKEF